MQIKHGKSVSPWAQLLSAVVCKHSANTLKLCLMIRSKGILEHHACTSSMEAMKQDSLALTGRVSLGGRIWGRFRCWESSPWVFRLNSHFSMCSGGFGGGGGWRALEGPVTWWRSHTSHTPGKIFGQKPRLFTQMFLFRILKCKSVFL